MAEENERKMTFEEGYRRLEEIGRLLEDESLPLEKAFQIFEEGQELLRRCQRMLDDAENRLKVIQVTDSQFAIQEKELE